MVGRGQGTGQDPNQRRMELSRLSELARAGFERLANWDQVEWQSYAWGPELRLVRGPSGAKVATFARRVLAIERAKAQRSRPTDFPIPLRGKKLGSRG